MKLDPDDIRSYEQRAYFDKNEQKGPSGLTIFISVLLAIIASWLIAVAFISWQARQAVEAFNQQAAVISAQSQERMVKIQAQQVAIREEAEAKVRFEALRVQREKEENQARLVAIAAEKAREEEAWKAYYKPIEGCEPSNQNREIVKCGNDYIKAKRKFESEWQAKK